jgi:hypothetical protein
LVAAPNANVKTSTRKRKVSRIAEEMKDADLSDVQDNQTTESDGSSISSASKKLTVKKKPVVAKAVLMSEKTGEVPEKPVSQGRSQTPTATPAQELWLPAYVPMSFFTDFPQYASYAMPLTLPNQAAMMMPPHASVYGMLNYSAVVGGGGGGSDHHPASMYHEHHPMMSAYPMTDYFTSHRGASAAGGNHPRGA